MNRHGCRMTRLLACLAAVGLPAARVAAATPPPVDFGRDVLPLLRRHCLDCHGGSRQEAGLRFDDGRAALAGGDGGAVIVPGSPAASELVRRVSLPRGDDGAMPPRGGGLSPREIDALRRWIAAGAPWPNDAAGTTHWAYRPPARVAGTPDAPSPSIDDLVAAAHAREGFSFSPPAERAVLARRVSFDLTGLPPGSAAVADFVADDAPDAYERFVDRLLAGDEFGVRWARVWLDLARYADSHGFQRDDLRDVWAYRDWVVDAFAADMPFDRFTIEQIAGDLLPDADERTRIATGFHRCSPTNVEAGTDPEASRFDQVLDRVNTTAAAWLGTTLECAQCHDHKHDPFTQADYYRLAAYFNSTEAEAERSNPDAPGSIRFVGPAMPLTTDPLAAERAALRERLTAARAVAATAGQPQAAAADRGPAAQAADVARLEAELAGLPAATTLVMRQLPEPRDTFVLRRGVRTDPGERVTPGTPAILGPPPTGPGDRLALARWLVSRDNPLTARVLVNRVWHEIFGAGIVPTVEDFGVKGEPPSHPELLDHLAVEFMDDGWSLKRLVRRIVTSRTYRQDSRLTPDLAARDPGNRWLARGPRFRLEAEAIRDNALAIAGLLSLAKGGPPIRPPQPEGLWRKVGGEQYEYRVSPGESRYRRGLYVVLKRASPHPGFTAFDATSRMTCTVSRSRSNTPLQALVLLNDPVHTEAALAFARRTLVERPGGDDRDRVGHAFRLAVAREPCPAEVDALLRLLAAARRSAADAPGRVADLLSAHPGVERPAAVTAAELAAWYAVATAILNLDETITKG